MPLTLGLTGPNAAGKGEVALYLQSRGFRLHSLSDIVREEAAKLGLPPEREHLIATGNRLRREGGPGALAEKILARLDGQDVVDSIRNPAEVTALRRLPRFVLIGVDAPAALRFERSLARGRPGDPLSVGQFQRREQQENTDDPNAQQLLATFRMTDYQVSNAGDLPELFARVDRVLDRLNRSASPDVGAKPTGDRSASQD